VNNFSDSRIPQHRAYVARCLVNRVIHSSKTSGLCLLVPLPHATSPSDLMDITCTMPICCLPKPVHGAGLFKCQQSYVVSFQLRFTSPHCLVILTHGLLVGIPSTCLPLVSTLLPPSPRPFGPFLQVTPLPCRRRHLYLTRLKCSPLMQLRIPALLEDDRSHGTAVPARSTKAAPPRCARSSYCIRPRGLMSSYPPSRPHGLTHHVPPHSASRAPSMR
jgi:hypothetical protein